MATVLLTDALLRKSHPPASGRIELWDTNVRGLGLRITSNDVRTWFIRYRTPSGQRRFKLGRYPHLPLREVRKYARSILAGVDKGNDPQREKIKSRSATAPLALEAAVERYLKDVERRNRSWRETQRILTRHLLSDGRRALLEDVRKSDLIAKLDALAETAPYSANALMRQLRRFFNWAIEKDLLQVSPMVGVKPPHREKTRDRILSDDEIRLLWGIWGLMPYPFGPFYKICLLTAQRRGEVANMRWEHIDENAMLWTLPRELTKSDRANEIPLSPQVWAILEELPRWSSGLVFTTNNQTPIAGFSKAKSSCDALANDMRADMNEEPFAHWRLHDLRRTAASGMASLRVQPHIVEKVLNHATGQISGVAAIYNRHGYLNEKREALEAWGDHIKALLRSDPAVEADPGRSR